MCDREGSGTGPIQVASVITLPIPSSEAVARELLLAALQDLSQEQLKRFRHKLGMRPWVAAASRGGDWSAQTPWISQTS